ncbi:MAG TPA: DUF47 family protein [Methanomassiliicoccales archaeon]|jgi:hypothetical protein
MDDPTERLNKGKRRGVLNFMFPTDHDFYGMLGRQADQTAVGVKTLIAWLESGANSDPIDLVKEEDKGDQLRLEMEHQLQESFSTPFDRQDIYTISRQMDHILNYSLSTAYEMRAFGVKPDEATMSMARSLLNGSELVSRCVFLLKDNPMEASNLIRRLREYEHDIEKTYVRNMALVFANDDAIVAMKKREIYHHLKDAGRNMSITVDVLHRIIVGLS